MRHILVGTIIATNVKSLNGGCGTAKSVAALLRVPHSGYAPDLNTHDLEPFLELPEMVLNRECFALSHDIVNSWMRGKFRITKFSRKLVPFAALSYNYCIC